MVIRPTSDSGHSNRDGSVMLVALVFLLIGGMLVASYLRLSMNDIRVTRIAIDQEKAFIVAEAGLDYAIMKLRDIISQYKMSPQITRSQLEAMLGAIPPPPPIDGYDYVTPGGASAFRIEVDSDVISGTITNGTSCRGSLGDYQYFTITVGCVNTNSGHGAVLKQTTQAVGLSLIRFGVFYEEDLEILPGPQMDFFGPVHANGDLYLGGPLKFHDRLTAAGDIYHRRKDTDERPGEVQIINREGSMTSMKDGSSYFDSDYSEWLSKSLQLWEGNVLSSAHGTSKLRPPINPLGNPHDIIERELSTNHPQYSAETESEKYRNKAALIINVDSNGIFNAYDYFGNDVTPAFTAAVLEVSGVNPDSGLDEFQKDARGHYAMSTTGCYDTAQTYFYDGRENCYMAPVDIYVGELIAAYPDVCDGSYSDAEGDSIIYITRDDPDGASNGVMPCVRLRNGGTIEPIHGITIASDLPVYIEGNYNTNDTKPSLVAGDAVTMLSSSWQDAASALSLSKRIPNDTEYNTVVMTGNEETTTGDYNGGLENVLRFLEKWSGKTVKFRGSIIDLWYSEVAKADWSYGTYYKAPNRDWGYDNIYRSVAPPGMTRVFGMEEILWRRTTWDEEGW